MPARNGISARLPSSELDFEQVARAVILDGDDGADGSPSPSRPSARSGRRDNIRLPRAAAARRGRFRSGFRAALRRPSDRPPLRSAPPPPCRALRTQAGAARRPREYDFCGGQAVDAVAEQLQPNLALDAMRAGDRGKRDPLVRSRRRHGYSAFAPSSAACGASSATASVSAVVSSTGAFGRLLARLRRSLRRVGRRRRLFGVASLADFSRGFFGQPTLRPRLRRLPRRPARPAASSPADCFDGSFLGDWLVGRQVRGVGRRRPLWLPRSLPRPEPRPLQPWPRRPPPPWRRAAPCVPWPSRPARPCSGCCARCAPSGRRRRGSEGRGPTAARRRSASG